MTPDPVLDIRAKLGECPVWDHREDVLYWIDIDSLAVHRYDPATATNTTRHIDGRPGSIALTADPDELLVAVEHRLQKLNWTTGHATDYLELERGGAPTRLNDGRCDRRGRFWVGSMNDPPAGNSRSGQLHRVDTTGVTTIAEEKIGVSNSLAFSPDGTVMYFSDTTRELLWSFDYDPDTGHRANRQVLLDFANLPGRPDGACVDSSGCLWVACVYGWALLRATPTGAVDQIVELPMEKPSMPAFGDPDLTTLYLTSISTGGSQPAAPGQALAGALVALDVGIDGIAEPLYAGPSHLG